jgi:hypothetical protein
MFTLFSCSSSLSQNTYLNSQYFSLTTPNEEDWDEIKNNDSENNESIWLQKGHGPGNLSEAEYPIKTLLIQRRAIQEITSNNELLISNLYELVQSDIKVFIDALSQRFYVDEFLEISFYSDELFLYQFTYNNSFPFDSTDPNAPPIPNLNQEKIPLGNGIGQYYIYLPKLYKEWNSYYLFLFDRYPAADSKKQEITFPDDVDIIKDSTKVKKEVSIEIAKELSDLIKSFSCIEDSIKK